MVYHHSCLLLQAAKAAIIKNQRAIPKQIIDQSKNIYPLEVLNLL